MKEIKRVGVSITIAAAGLSKLQAALEKARIAVEGIVEKCRQEEHHIHEQRWWQRGEDPPEFRRDANGKEWWERDEEPPSFQCSG